MSLCSVFVMSQCWVDNKTSSQNGETHPLCGHQCLPPTVTALGPLSSPRLWRLRRSQTHERAACLSSCLCCEGTEMVSSHEKSTLHVELSCSEVRYVFLESMQHSLVSHTVLILLHEVSPPLFSLLSKSCSCVQVQVNITKPFY